MQIFTWNLIWKCIYSHDMWFEKHITTWQMTHRSAHDTKLYISTWYWYKNVYLHILDIKTWQLYMNSDIKNLHSFTLHLPQKLYIFMWNKTKIFPVTSGITYTYNLYMVLDIKTCTSSHYIWHFKNCTSSHNITPKNCTSSHNIKQKTAHLHTASNKHGVSSHDIFKNSHFNMTSNKNSTL